MTRALTTTFRSALFGQNADEEVVLVLLELGHSTWSDSIRLTSDSTHTISNGETYIALPFELTLPDEPETGITQGKISIDAIDQSLIAAIRELHTAPSFTIKIVLASDPNTIEIEYTGYELVNISYNVSIISASISIEGFMGEPWPGDAFIPSMFPGLF